MTALREEWRITARDPIFRIAVAVLALLTVICLWNGARFEAERHAEATEEVQRSLDKRALDRRTIEREEAGEIPVSPWGPSEPTRAEAAVVRSPGPLAALSFGQEDMQPLAGTVSLWMTRADNLFRKYEFASPLTLAAGRFDAGFLVLLLLPLFALALGFNVIADERASGRMRVATVAGSGANYGRRLALRLALRMSPLLFCLALIGVVAAAQGAAGGRGLLWLTAASLYLIFWIGVASAIATLNRRAEAIALVGAAIWLAVVVVTPVLASATAHALSPVATEFQRITTIRAAERDANRRLLPNLLAYAAERPELSDTTYTDEDWSPKLYVSQLQVEHDIADALQRHAESRAYRQHWLARLNPVSPAAVADALLTRAAGTGDWRQAAFVAQAEAFLDRWRDQYAPMVFSRDRLRASDVDELPVFVFEEPRLPIGQVFVSLLYLGLSALAAVWVAWRRLAHAAAG